MPQSHTTPHEHSHTDILGRTGVANKSGYINQHALVPQKIGNQNPNFKNDRLWTKQPKCISDTG